MDDLADGTAQPVPQSELTTEGERLNEAPKLFKEHGLIDWSRDAQEIHNQIRGLHPFPGAWTTLPEGGTLRIHSSALSSDWGSAPGTVHSTKTELSVQCGHGAVSLLRVQPQGKQAMDVKDFLNGLRKPLRILGNV